MHEMHKIKKKRFITRIKQQFLLCKKIENSKIEKAMLKINSAYATI